MKTAVFFVSILFVTPTFGQINQTSPELCGRADRAVPLPSTVRATVDRSIGQGDLYLEIGGVTKKISLPGVVNEIDEVCPLSDGRLIVFSFTERGGLGEIDIVNSTNGSLLDSIWGFTPAMSPNQRWLAYRKFYPKHTELPVSEEYLLYDLTKSPTQNRPPDVSLSDYQDVGSAIFLLGQKNLEGDNIDLLPPEQQHSAGSELFWAPDSRAIAFGDVVQQKLSIVLVTLENGGNPAASVYPVSLAKRCSPPAVDDWVVNIQRIEVGNKEGDDLPIHIDFWSGACSPKPLEIRSSDFQKPKTEIHVRPKRKGVVVDPQ